MFKSTRLREIDLDEGIVDDEFLKRKSETAKRIGELRGKRIRLREELIAYRKFEKTGEKPMEDPALEAQILSLTSDLESETELNGKLNARLTTVQNELVNTRAQIQSVTDLIQRYKVENASDIMSASSLSHLDERKQKLEKNINEKELKLKTIEDDIQRLTKESDIKNKQYAVVNKITEWQQGEIVEATDTPYLQQAYQSYKTSTESWREARFNYDRKSIMPNFYLFSWKALIHGIDAYFILITQTDEDVSEIPIQDKIDLLYKNKIVVNTTLLDSLKAFVDRLSHNVEVTPDPNYPDKIYEFMQKNMSSLRAI